MSLDTSKLPALIRRGETLRTEFKGEQRKALSDSEIYEAVVCLANTEGGVLLLGIEKDGQVTGARPRHGHVTDPHLLKAAVFHNTVPPVPVAVSLHEVERKAIIAIEVERMSVVCATRSGKCVRRTMDSHGEPQCLPYYPHEHPGKATGSEASDYSATVVDARWDDLDPLEMERLRQTIRRLHGDNILLELDNQELAKALRLIETKNDVLVPNVAGLLLLGREEVLRGILPTHGIAFQVLDAQGEVKMNDWFYGPLLKSLESVRERFEARNQEREVQVGMLRIPVPDYAPAAFREAVNNAVLHRDYTATGAVFVQSHPDHLFIANPGGFVEGITLENLLVHEPKPRNTRLAEAFRRIGLVETTGRGVDKIYMGQLRYGRSLPNYARSDARNVRLVLQGGEENLAFAAFVQEQERSGTPLSLDDLIILNHLEHQRRADLRSVGRLTQKGDAFARALMERLVERGLVEPRGEKKGRIYHLSATIYKKMGSPTGYVHAHGFEPIQQEQMVLQYLEKYKKIKRSEAVTLCKISSKQATALLKQMTTRGLLLQQGQKRGSFYILASEL